jgi:hypothetical protein
MIPSEAGNVTCMLHMLEYVVCHSWLNGVRGLSASFRVLHTVNGAGRRGEAEKDDKERYSVSA